jgi:hypothetical protein
MKIVNNKNQSIWDTSLSIFRIIGVGMFGGGKLEGLNCLFGGYLEKIAMKKQDI